MAQEIKDKVSVFSTKGVNSGQIRNNRLFATLRKLIIDETIYTQAQIDRKAIASMLNTNEKYLFDSIKENTGLAFSEYINGLRLNVAEKLLLTNNNFTIEDIAIRSGFGSRTTFHRQFRKKHEVSPAKFREISVNSKSK